MQYPIIEARQRMALVGAPLPRQQDFETPDHRGPEPAAEGGGAASPPATKGIPAFRYCMHSIHRKLRSFCLDCFDQIDNCIHSRESIGTLSP